MAVLRKRYSAEMKAKIALEAIKGQKTANEIATEYGVHPTQIAQWKKQALDGLPEVFSTGKSKQELSEEALIANLYQQIGQLKVQVDWLEKNQNHSVEQKRTLIDPTHPELSIRQQCKLLSLTRSSYYYEAAEEREENLVLMRLLDEQYTRTPFYGSRKMTAWLHTQGYAVDRKRVRRLLHLMGLETIYPKPHLSASGAMEQRYPYLLRGMTIEKCNQVWSCDITYIRLQRGFIYLMAVMDCYSRYVLSWEISITLDTSFCLEALDRALHEGTPEIFNTDQGAQFTSSVVPNTRELLQHAEQDASDMAWMLREAPCGFKLIEPVLRGSDAKTWEVQQAILDLAERGTEEDFLLFYFSGHAQPIETPGGHRDIYLVTHNFKEKDVKLSPTMHISMRWLREVLYNKTQAGAALLILDCCYAGNITSSEADSYLMDLGKLIEDWLEPNIRVRKDRPRAMLTATGYDVTAQEKDGHGLMTRWILRALRGEDDEVLDDNGYVDVFLLHRYLKKKIPEQVPNLAGEFGLYSWILASHASRSTHLLQDQEKNTEKQELKTEFVELHRKLDQYFAERSNKDHTEPFDHMLCDNASFEDLDRGKVTDYLNKTLVLQEENFLFGISDQEQFTRLGLLRDLHPTHGTLLCFGQDPSQWIPSAITRCIDSSSGPDNLRASKRYRKCLLKQFEESYLFLVQRLNSVRLIDKEGSTDDLEIPSGVLREALANALIHREYGGRSDCIMVEVYSDRVEISSPGDIPEGISLENIQKKHGSHPRNSQIANIFSLYGLVEESGRGIERMQRFMADMGLPEPQFKVSEDKRFIVTLFRPKEASERIVRSEAFGVLLSQGIKAAVTSSKGSLDVVMNELNTEVGAIDLSMIERWQRGFVPTRQDQVTALARMCVRQGKMSKEWLETFLKEAHYLNPELLRAELYPTPLVSKDRNRPHMLGRLRSLYRDLRARSLQGAASIALDLQEKPDAVENPWRLLAQGADQPAQALPPGTHITQVYDNAGGELLILGDPGSGKTTLLLELARDLLARAEKDDTFPMPVVFNLSTWTNKRQPITDWMVEFLNQKHQVPRMVARSWVEADQVLPLLDGLDEVDPAYLAACIGALNAYRHEHGLVPTVVCSREAAYQGQSARLLLHTAVVIQPLTPQQIDDYLSRQGEAFETVRTALRANPDLQKLAAAPFLLVVIAKVYLGNRVEDLPANSSLELRRNQLFATYVQLMFEHRSATKTYTPKQTTHYLTWLARQLDRGNQEEFYVEQLQPDWLPSIGAHRLYRGITTIILAMLFFGAAGLLVGAAPGLGFGLAVGGLIGALNSALNLILRFTWRKAWSWLRLLIKCCCFGLIGGLAFALLTRLAVGQFHGQDLGSTNGPIFGVIAAVFGLLVDRLLGAPDMNIKLAEVVVWSWRRLAQSLVLFLCLGLAGGIIFALFSQYASSWIAIILGLYFGLILGLFFGLIGGWSSQTVENKDRTTPNQGIWRSARNGLRIGLRAGTVVGLIFGLFFGLIAIVDFVGNPRMLLGIDIVPDAGLTISGKLVFAILLGLYFALSSGFFTGFVAGLFSGWDAWIKHFVLRFLLSRSGCLPWSLPNFLDYAAERIFLCKVGGGYIFVHQLLREYFASLDTSSPSQETPLSSEYD